MKSLGPQELHKKTGISNYRLPLIHKASLAKQTQK